MRGILGRAVLTIAACVSIAGTAIAQAAYNPQTVSVPSVTVTMKLGYTVIGHHPVIDAVFSTSDPEHDSVYCLNAYRDLNFVLHDSSGRIVPINKDAWKQNMDRVSDTESGQVPGAPDPCKTVKVERHESRALLSALYPNVPHGSYTLDVSLAPRATAAHAAFAPLKVQF